MATLFKLLGVLLGCYVAQAIAAGAVYAKSGAFGRLYRRDEDRAAYWSTIVVYTLLSIALIFVF